MPNLYKRVNLSVTSFVFTQKKWHYVCFCDACSRSGLTEAGFWGKGGTTNLQLHFKGVFTQKTLYLFPGLRCVLPGQVLSGPEGHFGSDRGPSDRPRERLHLPTRTRRTTRTPRTPRTCRTSRRWWCWSPDAQRWDLMSAELSKMDCAFYSRIAAPRERHAVPWVRWSRMLTTEWLTWRTAIAIVPLDQMDPQDLQDHQDPLEQMEMIVLSSKVSQLQCYPLNSKLFF